MKPSTKCILNLLIKKFRNYNKEFKNYKKYKKRLNHHIDKQLLKMYKNRHNNNITKIKSIILLRYNILLTMLIYYNKTKTTNIQLSNKSIKYVGMNISKLNTFIKEKIK